MSRVADLLRPLIAGRRFGLDAIVSAVLVLASLPAITAVSAMHGTVLLTAPGDEGGTISTDLVTGWAVQAWWTLSIPLIAGLLVHRRLPRTALLLAIIGAGGHLLDLYRVGLGIQPVDAIVVVVLIAVVSQARTRWASVIPFVLVLLVTYLLAGTPAGPVVARAIESAFHPQIAPLPEVVASPTIGLFAQVVIVAAFVIGESIRARHAQLRGLRQHAEALEREQQQREQMAAAVERARIARDLHDIVAHRVTGMLVQAGAARALLAGREPEAVAALHAVEIGGRDAMTELRDLLGLLTAESAGTPLSPTPGITAITAMAADAAMPVRLTITGDPQRLPRGIDLAAYRIVQEALTNAARHSTRAGSTVDVHIRETTVEIVVLDDGAVPARSAPHGHGLIGMRERVTPYGGTVTAGPRTDGRWQVRATLPLPANSQAP